MLDKRIKVVAKEIFKIVVISVVYIGPMVCGVVLAISIGLVWLLGWASNEKKTWGNLNFEGLLQRQINRFQCCDFLWRF